MKFFSDISLWWLLPIAIFAFALAYLYYRRQKDHFENLWLYRLVTALRGLGIFTLLLLLLGIVVKSTQYESQKPIFIQLVDDSASMKNFKDSSQIQKQVEDLEAKISSELSEKFEIKKYSFSDVLQSKQVDFSGQKTNVSDALQEIYELYFNQNVGGVAIVSDGNFNEGSSPISIAKKMKFVPFFNIGTGDTTLKKDLAIKNVEVNNVAFLGNDFPIEVDVEATDFPNGKTKVSIFSGEKVIQSKEVQFSDENQSIQSVNFLMNASSLGIKKYRVEVEQLQNESTVRNNSSIFYIDVIDSRRKILILANSPHPDISAIKSTLEKDEKTKVTSKLFSKWSGDASQFDLVILFHPDRKFVTLNDELTTKKTPVLYVLSADSRRNFVDQLNLNVNYPFGSKLDYTQGGLNSKFQLFSLSESTEKMLSRFPPMLVPFGEIKTAGIDNFLVQRIGTVRKKSPIFSLGTINSRKVGVVFGEGLWKWKLTNYQLGKNTEAFDEIIGKTTQFLVVKKNNDALKVTMPKRISSKEDVLVQAEFYNANFEMINSPKISFELTNEKDEKFDYEFSKREKDYSLLLNGLKSGAYEWIAQTTFDGKAYSKKGTFVVEENSIEQIATNADHSVLQQLAKETQGRFASMSSADDLVEEIKNRDDLTSVAYEKETFKGLIDYKWLFFLAILLFGLEWFIRRWNGNY